MKLKGWMKAFIYAFSVFIIFAVFIFPNKEQILFSFSPQGKIDPENTIEEYDSQEVYGVFDNFLVEIPPMDYYLAQGETDILGESAGDKRIEIDLTNQRLYAFEGGSQIYNFLISSGKWGRTPTGSFNVWTKLRATKMSGGSKALGTYYYLPNVPYTMFFYNANVPKWRGYGIHGTYWHNNFGHPMSHGCINMRTEEAGLLFNWAYVGIPVIIYGNTPAS